MAKAVLKERGLKKIRLGIEGNPDGWVGVGGVVVCLETSWNVSDLDLDMLSHAVQDDVIA